jgi:parallel beta-helix repeat protein
MKRKVNLVFGIFAVTMAIVLTYPSGVWAVHGATEINQRAARRGAIPGDGRGFPVTISRPGSYILTGNLTVPDASTTAIEITAENVTLDLNGFTISGPTRCSGGGSSIVCSPFGSGDGINSISRHTIVKNGSITGMGNTGILVAGFSRVERIHLQDNSGNGISAASGSIVTGNIAIKNGGWGISVGGFATIINNTTRDNGSYGIFAGATSIVSNNTASSNGAQGIKADRGTNVSANTAINNGGRGIEVADGSTVIGNTAFDNDGDGIFVLYASLVKNNTASSNGGDGINASARSTVIGNSSNSNFGDGIETGNNCIVKNNAASDNRGGYGLNLGGGSGYTNNVLSSNVSGQVSGGIELEPGSNLCNGFPCP